MAKQKMPLGSVFSPATTKAVATAHHAPIDAAIQTALWERRGFLRRLARTAA